MNNGRSELPDERAKRTRFGRRALAGFTIMLALLLRVGGHLSPLLIGSAVLLGTGIAVAGPLPWPLVHHWRPN